MNGINRLAAIVSIVSALVGCGGSSNIRTTYYPDGAIRWQVETRDGIPHGRSVTFHPNGVKASEGRYEDGEPVGSFHTWDAAGFPTNGGTKLAGDTAELPDPFAEPNRDAPSKRYVSLGLHLGGAGAAPVEPVDTSLESPSGLRVDVSAIATARLSWLVIGAAGDVVASEGEPGNHRYFGLLSGVGFGSTHHGAEVVLEVGNHQLQVGEGPWRDAATVARRYAGLRANWWFAGSGYFRFVLTGAIRKDSRSDVESVEVHYCATRGCFYRSEEWAVGGRNATIGFGLRFLVP